jgi:Fur family ferric uptake transcriptional regulator
VSAARRVVLEALFAAEGPLSAERIASGLDGRLTPSDLASVYRNLERLQELGVVSHVHLGHGPALWALAGGGEREYLVCERCGEVRSLEPRTLDAVRALVRDRSGFEASFAHFAIVGLCRRCFAAIDEPAVGSRHEHAHSHEHHHGDVAHAHLHTAHEHEHTEHQHEHSHGDYVHSHPHVHEHSH